MNIMNIKQKLTTLLLLIVGAGSSLFAQTTVTVGTQVTSESQLVSGKAYVLQSQSGGTGTVPYINDNGTNYDIPMSNACNESSVYYLISNGNGTWKIKNYYTNHFWGVPVYGEALASVADEASAGVWSLNFSNGIAYPTAPDAESTIRGLDRSSNKLWGYSTGTGGTKQVKIYEVGLTEKGLTSPVNIVSGWYLIKWVDTNSDTNTNYLDSDVNGKYVKNYAQDETVNSNNYSLYLDEAPTETDGIAHSLIYFEKEGSSSGRGVDGYLRSANGHYVTQTGAASSSKVNKNYIIYRSSGTPNYSVITSEYTGTRYSLIPCGKDATPYIGQSAQDKFPVAQFYSVDFSLYGLQPWSVEFDGEENAQVEYTGSDASGLTTVYNGGTFFLTTGVTPTVNQFTAPTRWGFSPDIEVDATNHIVKVTYIDIHKVYTINNTNSNRGALIYNPDASTKYVWSSGKSGTFNASNANSQWVIIPTGTSGQFYLYNVGAGKFAIPTAIAQGSGNAWVFSDNAVAVIFETQGDGTKKIKMATNPVSGTNAAYMAVSNNYTGPIINWNDEGGNFTITKVDGQDQSTAANAAVAKLVKSQTKLTTYPQTTGWYVIQIKSKSGSASYANRYVQCSSTLYNDLYPLTFTGAVDVQPAITDPSFFTHLDCRDWNDNDWQLPDGRFLVCNASNKFPTVSNTASAMIAGYDSGNNYFKSSNNYFADPYNSGANYFIGETDTYRTTYNVYPIDLATAGLTVWKVTVEGLDASTQVTCTRSDVKGLASVYNNGYFFLPSGSTPANGEFTATINGSILTLPVTINTEAHTITASLPVLTINSPRAEATFTWNGVSKTGKSVTFVYTGETISDNTITVSYTGNEYTSPTLSQSTWDGTSSATVTLTLTPAFFSTNYGDKWVRIVSAKAPTLVVDLASTSAGGSTTMQGFDYFDDAQLWCLVGNASSFTLYNKAAGNGFVLTSGASSPGQNTTISLQAAGASNSTWTLGDGQFASDDAPGYAIYATSGDGNNSMHGWQSGNTVKYWGAASGGSHFLIADASGEVTLAFAGLDPSTMTVYTQNIANLPTTIVGNSSQTLLTKDNFTSRTAYVPNNSELTFGTPAMFQNYGFTGYDGSNQTKTVTATTTPQTVTATFSVVRPDARYLWEPLRIYNGSGEPDYYRIPAIVTAKNGDIIAINDRRWNNDTDLGNNSGTAASPVDHHIDIIGVASSDNGNTWGSEFMIMDGTGSGALAGYGDAAAVADRESNKILVMACAGDVFYSGQNNSYHQTIQRTVLTHNGTTWVADTPTDVTSQFFAGSLASSDGMFIGSGVIAQSKIIKKGDYYRIYCAVLERSNSNYVFYSDDFGSTWTMMGSTAPANDNEPKVEELPDGSVLLSVRKSYGRTFNVWTWDDATYTTGSWGTAVASNNQTGGISFGNNSTNGDIRVIPAIKKATGEMVTLAMQSVPTAGSRAEVSLYYKELDPSVTYTPTTIAQNWSSRFLVTPHSSAYSSFTPQPDGRIGLYMEEAPKSVTGFYMCYVPLTLDEITSNQYTGIASTYPVTLNDVGTANYATLYLPFDVTTDANTKAYYISSVSGEYAQLTEVSNSEIAANTAVVLINESSSSATFNVTSGLVQQVSESANLLKGTLTPLDLDLSDSTPYYAMGKKDNQIGFYKFDDNNGTTTITLAANKAYLDTTTPVPVKGFVFDFDEDATGIETIDNRQRTTDNGVIYNLAGQRLNKPVKGVNIINGKKVLK